MKKLFFLFVLSCICGTTFAQATDLVVDCQTPGWLSSKINYGDQQTVKNLKVTGYINTEDLKFIGTLIEGKTLNEKVDLSNANIVDNTMTNNCFGISKYSNKNLRCLSLPKTVEKIESILPHLHVDTLYFNCNIKYIKGSMFSVAQFAEMPHNIIVGEKVDSIPNEAFLEKKGIVSMKLPKGIRYIGNRLFTNLELQYCNFNDLENLEYLGYNAFSYYDSGTKSSYQPDTLIIPHSLHNPFYLFAFAYKDGQHIFIEDNIKEISGYSRLHAGLGSNSTTARLHFHINNMVPPSIVNYKFSNENVDLTTSFVYVPKGAKDAYLKSDWKHATIIETKPIENIRLDRYDADILVGKQIRLTAIIEPSDADDKTIEWRSSNGQIVSVDESGNITALKAGEAWIKVVSVVNPEVKDSCRVTAIQPVTGVSLLEEKHTFDKAGDTIRLTATIMPVDASNKETRWSSSNENVCIVKDGLATAVAPGTATVTVTTVDGNFTASCIVKVVQHVIKVALDKSEFSLKVNEMEQLSATVSPDNAENKAVAWASSNEQVAIVDAKGKVTALKAGEAWVKIMSLDNPEANDSCKVAVIQPVTGVTLSESTYKLKAIGENVQLTATVLPEDASNKKVNWSSSNSTVCIVSNGNVVAVGGGTSVIMATTEDGGFLAYCVVTVEDTTGIIDVKDNASNSGSVYDMMGRKVQKPKKGRLYIKQGKKYIIR